MKFLDTEGVRQLKELNDAAYVGKEEYNDDTMVISAALNDLNSRVTTAESEIAGFSGGDENIIETVKVNGTALTVTDKAVDVTVPTTLASLTDDSTHRLVTDTEKTTWSGKANTASPAFTGTPTAPTAAAGTNTTQIATTAFVQNAVNSASAYEYFVNLDLGTISSFNGVYVQDLQFEDANGNTVYPSMYDTDSPTKPIYVTFTYSIPGEDPMGRDTVSGTEGILFTEFAWDDSYVYTSGSAMAYSIVEGLNGYDYVLQSSNGDWSFSIQKHVEYSSYEKTKLQGIAAGAEVNVQSDWSVTDSTSDAYIVNKPTIPTKVSDLTNDSGFTTNIGTITGITMNGASKGTSGVVDLGTVITDVSGKADASAAIGTLSLAIDNTNYQITLSGTKVDGTTFTVSNVIDLPLESVVVNGSYNNTTKKVVLTLQNGNTVDFSVADLVAGLQSEITSTNKLSADLISDGTTNKVYTATEQTKLAGIAAGAEVNVNADWNASSGDAQILNKPTIPTKVSDLTNDSGFTSNTGTITGITMNNVSKGTSGVVDLGTVLTSHQDISGKEDTSNKVSSLPAGNYTTEYMQSHFPSLYYLGTVLGNYELTSNKITSWPYDDTTHQYTPTDTQYPSAKLVNDTFNDFSDWLSDGFQQYEDHSSNSSITSISQIGWNAPEGSIVRIDSTHCYERYNGSWVEWTGPSSSGEANVIEGVSFNGTTAPITNKIAAITASIPTVNNSTISIQKGGTAVDSFTTNASSGKTINIPNELPSYSSSDSGKILSVNNSGALVWITPSYIYSGSSAPSNSIGNNGDIYLQTS